MPEKITIEDLLESGVHFGHQVSRWNPKMKKYVYGVKNGIHIIDLKQTMQQLAEACNFLQKAVYEGEEILFVGTKRQAQEIVQSAAEESGMFYITERWLGGTLTNNATIRKSINKMYSYDRQIENDQDKMTKKEHSHLYRSSQKLHRYLDGIAEMKKMPAAIFIVDTCQENIAVREAHKLNIPIVAITDTNADPDDVSYPIPGNDDAIRSIRTITNVVKDSVKAAAELHRKKVAEEKAEKEKKKAEETQQKKEASKQTAKKEESKKEAPKKEAAQKDTANKETPKKEEAKKETSKKETPKKTTSKKQAPKKEATKKETSKKQEATQEEKSSITKDGSNTKATE